MANLCQNTTRCLLCFYGSAKTIIPRFHGILMTALLSMSGHGIDINIMEMISRKKTVCKGVFSSTDFSIHLHGINSYSYTKHKIRDFTKCVPHSHKTWRICPLPIPFRTALLLTNTGLLVLFVCSSLRVSEFSHLCSDRRCSVSSQQDVSSSA